MKPDLERVVDQRDDLALTEALREARAIVGTSLSESRAFVYIGDTAETTDCVVACSLSDLASFIVALMERFNAMHDKLGQVENYSKQVH